MPSMPTPNPTPLGPTPQPTPSPTPMPSVTPSQYIAFLELTLVNAQNSEYVPLDAESLDVSDTSCVALSCGIYVLGCPDTNGFCGTLVGNEGAHKSIRD
jgi:hypothetical protein